MTHDTGATGSPGEIGAAQDREPPGEILPPGDADTGGRAYLGPLEWGIPLFNPKNTPAEICSVVLACKGKGLADLCGAAAELLDYAESPIMCSGSSSTPGHERDAFDRLKSAKQHGMTDPFLSCHDIAAEMHPVCEVDIEVSPLTEHHFITIRATAKRMAGRVQITEVRFHLDNPPCKLFPPAPADEVQTEQLPGDPEGWL